LRAHLRFRREGESGGRNGELEPKGSTRRVDKFVAGLISLVGVLGERMSDDRVDLGGKLSPPAGERGRLLVEMGVQSGGRPRALERRLAGQALVEHAAERVEVGTPVGRLARDLLGRGVIDGAGEMSAGHGSYL
jgi:hypothetical protein